MSDWISGVIVGMLIGAALGVIAMSLVISGDDGK